MITCLNSDWRFLALLSAGLMCAPQGYGATTNAWTNATSSVWADATNWSAARLPDAAFDYTLITNPGTKTVILDAATPTTSRSVFRLYVSAPGGSTNTLFITGLPDTDPFITSGTLLVDAGGQLHVTNSRLTIGSTFDVSGNLTLDSGIIDSAAGFVALRVGRANGTIGSVNLNGGLLNCFGFRLGTLNGSEGLCAIDGGTLLSSSVVSMGEALNSPGTLVLHSGNLIATNDITKVGNLAVGTFDQRGGASELAFLSIGDNAPGMMTVSGGQVTVTPAVPTDITRVGNFGDAQLHISNGTVRLRGRFHVADNPGVNGTVLVSGGQLIATNDLVAIGRYGIGEVTVTNASTWFTNTSVGRHTDAVGTLNVQNGASVACVDDLSIGRFTNAMGNVNVTGGLLTLVGQHLWVGREGIGNLTVSDGRLQARTMFVGMSPDGTNTPQGTVLLGGGTTLLSSNLLVGTSLLSRGQVVVTGGLLAITNALAGGLLDVRSGTVMVSQGTVVADTILLTNAAGGLVFAGGTLQARNMAVSNGSPFVVGDGAAPATLDLQGGTFAFADGLVISANATVTGCGSIAGTIVNNGLLETNCGPLVVISSITRTGAVTTVVFSTIIGSNHVLEFKRALNDPAWTSILPGVAGAGTPASAQDLDATNAARFYRIRLQ